MKKFTIQCVFDGEKHPVQFYIGLPDKEQPHPLFYQELWLQKARGAIIPTEAVETFQKLHRIALENDANFEELCMHALGSETESAQKKPENPGD